MSKLLIKVKERCEKLICSTHQKHPELTIVGENINVVCCCEDFKKEINIETKEALKIFAKTEFSNMLKKVRKH